MALRNGDETDYVKDDADDEEWDIPVEEYVDIDRQRDTWRWVAIAALVVFVALAIFSLR